MGENLPSATLRLARLVAMETLLMAATATLAAAATATSTTPTVGAHNGIAPAAAMPTPFDFPCGINFLSNEFHKNKHLRDVCGPPNFENYWWSTIGYYSPAVCPRGYTAGCFRWNSDQGPPVEPTETAVQCVPRYVFRGLFVMRWYE